MKSLDERELLTEELQQQLERASSMTELEDLYLPYRPKRRTRATIAKEKGLEAVDSLVQANNAGSGAAASCLLSFYNVSFVPICAGATSYAFNAYSKVIGNKEVEQAVEKLKKDRKALKKYRKHLIHLLERDGVEPEILRTTDKNFHIRIKSGKEKSDLIFYFNPYERFLS